LRLVYHNEELPNDLLLAYDENIVRHWKRITERRNRGGHVLHMKYFQYLALLFTEIYLDRYFRGPEKLLADLNAHVEAFNAGQVHVPGAGVPGGPIPEASRVDAFTRDDLNKVAFWMAMGAGKTLIMHVNVLQYLHYLELHGRKSDLNRIILLTPNEGLSRQHLEEFALSGIPADLFQKDAPTLFTEKAVEVIDIHKLREEMGQKTVAVEAFEGNNLVLVDEGHAGARTDTGVWMERRRQLCERGFSFEYSATFGQAMQGRERDLAHVYAKAIILDYSYRHFYRDGYGKEYHILNLADDSDEDARRRYFTACLLAFYQQQKLYRDRAAEFRPYLIEKPLLIFVGGKVTAIRKEGGRPVSDVTDILLLLAEFVRDRRTSVAIIKRLLAGKSDLLDPAGRDIFSDAYTYLGTLGTTPEQVYEDVLATLLNAPHGGALHVENLKGTDGEIALRIGDNEPFGLVNVGDASGLCRLCETHDELAVADRDFSGSLFQGINAEDSTVNVLIGSKKFTEGWSSWRVSTMGLMNIGRTEGPMIIQLFGRGVRLKGWDYTLKRSGKIVGLRAPRHILTLETLNVFGVRADYMGHFRKYLEDEGLPSEEERVAVTLPVVKNLGRKKLKVIRLPDEIDFKRNGPKPTLAEPPDHIRRHPVAVDWYPKLQAMASVGRGGSPQTVVRAPAYFDDVHLAFMDLDAVYFEIQRHKNERAWHNLNLPREAVGELLQRKDWYVLYASDEAMQFRSFRGVRTWQEMAAALLKKYCDRYYYHRKREYEQDHLEIRELDESDPNFFDEYQLMVAQSRSDIVEKLKELEGILRSGKLREFDVPSLRVVMFDRHLYQPLLHAEGDAVEVRPVTLETVSERDFVLDLKAFCVGNPGFLAGKELYLLRNLSRGRGIGFFEAGGFYPDFILWLLAGAHQYISFVDPKGLRNVEGLQDPKVRFHETIKELERDLADPDVTLNLFIVSGTRYDDLLFRDAATRVDLEARNVLFQYEGRPTYVSQLLSSIVKH
jgi:hypothetical protein